MVIKDHTSYEEKVNRTQKTSPKSISHRRTCGSTDLHLNQDEGNSPLLWYLLS
ncbi:unnamed protein product [Acidithrix sp. C25]|nr:unnamed protein product [Acidithrix sp. C25]